jgi:long-chain acyl-CoA synthetase
MPEKETRSKLDQLIDVLESRGDQTLVQVFTATESNHWSYRSVGEQVQTLARGVRQHLEPGEPIALIGANRPEWIIAALAIIRAGAVVMPLDVQLADDTLRHVFQDSDARWIFTTTVQQERAHTAAPNARIVLLDAADDQPDGWRSLTGDEAALPENHADDPAVLFYTSGATGPPKGVPLTHGNLAFQLDLVAKTGIAQTGDRVLLPLPLHHVYPFVIGMLAPLGLGLTLIFPHALTGPQVIRAVREGQASVMIGVPRLYAALFEGIVARAERAGRPGYALFQMMFRLSRALRQHLGLRLGKYLLYPLHRQVGAQLRMLTAGGSALDADLAWNLEALGWQVTIGYGLTETAPLLSINRPDQSRPATVGQPVSGVELRIDQQAAPAQQGHPGEGEIQVRGPNVFAGYRNQPDKTAKAFTEDGWFRTGDLGWLDDEGYLHITGRISTLIITESGENLQPDDLEARYAVHEDIREIGILQHDGRLTALIVPSHEITEHSEDRIQNAVSDIAGKLPSYQRLVDVALTDKPLPRTRLGKIRRHLLAQLYEHAQATGAETRQAAPLDPQEMSSEDRTLLEQSVARTAWEWLVERYPRQGLTPDTRPELDLGVDSLAWLNLTLELGQRTGVELDDEAIGRIETVRDLLQELINAAGRTKKRGDPLANPEQALDAGKRRWLEPRSLPVRVVANGLYGVNWALLHGLFRLKAHDRHRVPTQGPVVLVCNHASYLDPFALAAALPPARLRTLYWGGWTGAAFNNPLTRFFSRATQVIPIDPQHGARASLALAAAVIARDRGLIWFPAGQRSPSGEPQPFRPGIGLLLERFPAPVVPVAIVGSHAALPPGRRLPRFNRISIHFGEAIDSRQLGEQSQGDSGSARIVDALEGRLRALLAHASTDEDR